MAEILIKPQKLSLGDTIGVVSPSSNLAALAPHRVQKGISNLEQLGFKIKVGQNVYKNSGYTAGTAEERADDLNKMFADPEVKAIISTIGGFHSNQILPYLDFDLIKKNPKIFLGFSDISVLHFALHTKANLVTFYGPALMTQFGENFGINPYTLEFWQKALMQKEPIGLVNPSEKWTDEFLNWFKKEDLVRSQTLKENLGFVWLKKGRAEGKILGGCITSMRHLVGTEFWPDFSKKVFFWEIPESSCNSAVGESVEKVDSYLTDLKLSGVLGKISGMIIGRPKGYTEEQTKQLQK
ncbi:MAG: LD-carboxypeptidase, partial [Candidatus Magasanikbacteria bacterium]|nr:LD-carboxypeptidase [Candidatus Magasanikbacteria bacterium]